MPTLNVANDLNQEPITQASLHQKKGASLQQKPLNISSSVAQHKKAQKPLDKLKQVATEVAGNSSFELTSTLVGVRLFET